MFVDKVTVHVQAGKGGNGAVSFRHEKFIDKGGPDGGDGGNGGDVVFIAEHNMSSLAKFRFNPRLIAEDGVNGSKRKRRGARGKSLEVRVPVGTVVYDGPEFIVDFTEPGQQFVVAEGGRGGFGNAHFISSVRQTPRVAEIGELGEGGELTMELKMLADVGLVGLPNAGKSTFLSIVTSAKPEIADYPFTTLKPNLGVADIDSSSLLIADIPGLIEGAAEGKGLGDEFLRHVERTKVLLHLIDVTSDTLAADYETIQAELKAYKVDLTKRTQLIALTKTDILDDELVAMQLAELKKVVPKSVKIIPISSLLPQEVKKVLRELAKMVSKHRDAAIKEASRSVTPVYELTDELAWKVKKSKIGFDISGHRIEKFAGRTDFESEDGLRRLKDIMRRMGIVHELERQGVQNGHLITICGRSFEW